MIHNHLTELIGHTPMLRIEAHEAHILLKLECFNPGGSIKDRAALWMIDAAEKDGKIQCGSTIIEPTSGNTGVGLAWIGRLKGYKVLIVMPENMSIERQKLLKVYGAQVVLTPAEQGMQGAIDKAKSIQEKTANSLILNQFDNEANALAHYHTTAEEIWRDCHGQVDVLVATVGTSGTLSGTALRLKELNPALEVVAVEPATSPVLSGGKASKHGIQGIGAGFIPKLYRSDLVDRIERVSDSEAFEQMRYLAENHGLMVGISSGAAFAAAKRLSAENVYRNKNIVTILPDSGERYLSLL